MTQIIRYRTKIGIKWAIAFSLMLIDFGGCKAPDRIFTIGIVAEAPIDVPLLQGFKQGMAEFGYIEDENIKYIYKNVLEHDEYNIDAGIKELLAQDIDILLTIESKVSLRAKELVKSTDKPLLFSANPFPVESGLVESMSHPGGNITGVMIVDTASKTLETLTMIIPSVKKVYLPYNPNDRVSISILSKLGNTASQLGIEIDFHKIHSVEETVASIEGLPEDVGAIFMIPSPTLNPRSSELIQAGIKRGIPMGASLLLDEAVLVSLTNDFLDTGKKTARLAHQINQGVKPADLPIETADVYLIINLITAEKLGINIPDAVLAQAKTIIR